MSWPIEIERARGSIPTISDTYARIRISGSLYVFETLGADAIEISNFMSSLAAVVITREFHTFQCSHNYVSFTRFLIFMLSWIFLVVIANRNSKKKRNLLWWNLSLKFLFFL